MNNIESKAILQYYIPIQTENYCHKMNTLLSEICDDEFDQFYPTEIHIDHLIENIKKHIEFVRRESGGYNGDAIRVKVEIEYEQENK